ncbi:hypothetical protein OG767_01770 [Micromonospora sp. NBC_01392]|uniref:hypothetical protein n=1 Tax=Micromonospora sp. NBC_01392 TaxID=2903588 RepID=UPI003247768D
MTAPRRTVSPATSAPFRSGDVLRLTRAASPQFARPIAVRVIRTLEWPTFDGWCWLDGYQLGPDGSAVARRELFVQLAGVRLLTAPTIPSPARRAPSRRTPVQVGA